MAPMHLTTRDAKILRDHHRQETRAQVDELQHAMETGLADHVPRPARFAALKLAGATDKQAKQLAGYSANTPACRIKRSGDYRQYRDEIRRRRIVLSQRRGLRLEDSADWYRSMSECGEAQELRARATAILEAGGDGAVERAQVLLEEAAELTPSAPARVRARERLDKLLGYDSPVEVETSDTRDDASTAGVLIQVLQQQFNATPLEMRQILAGNTPQAIPADATVVDDGSADCSGPHDGGGGQAKTDNTILTGGTPLQSDGVGGGSDSHDISRLGDPTAGPSSLVHRFRVSIDRPVSVSWYAGLSIARWEEEDLDPEDCVPELCPECGGDLGGNVGCWECSRYVSNLSVH